MATSSGTTLKMYFDTMGGPKTWSFKHAKADAATARIQALGQTMIDNGSIYKYPPMQFTGAELVVTTVQQITPA